MNICSLHTVSWVVISLAFTPMANAARFVASGQLGPSWITVTGFTPSGALSFTPTWSFDFETDGQSITFHQYVVSFNGTIQLPSHQHVYLDFSLDATLSGIAYDINPVSEFEMWQMQPYTIPDLHVAGTYHSFDFANSFDTIVHPGSSPTFDTQLSFRFYPDSMTIGSSAASFGFNTDLITASNLNIELEPRLFMTGLDLRMTGVLTANVIQPLTCSCCDCADFSRDGDADAADYVLWRKTFGQSVAMGDGADGDQSSMIDMGDFDLWWTNFGTTAAAGSGSRTQVPEPSSVLLCVFAAVSIRLFQRAAWRFGVSTAHLSKPVVYLTPRKSLY